MTVPNTFASATTAIPLSSLDANFAYYDNAFSIAGTVMEVNYTFRLEDPTDNTKKAEFVMSGITTGTTRQYTLPNLSGALATTGTVTQTFTGNTAFSNATSTFGSSTATSAYSLGSGATISGATKTISIGTSGVSGSTTNITIGSAVSGSITDIDVYGNLQNISGATMPWAPAPASIAAAATLSNANIKSQIINTTGTTYTLTMPLGTTLETLASWSAVNLGYNFTVINTASGPITMAVNTGVTSLGSLMIAIGGSANFQIRRTAANTFILYRMS
jgi:hypothetical protein